MDILEVVQHQRKTYSLGCIVGHFKPSGAYASGDDVSPAVAEVHAVFGHELSHDKMVREGVVELLRGPDRLAHMLAVRSEGADVVQVVVGDQQS